ncbi:MAG: hypothetical protein IPI44_18390 [Sulfuritalea sp.]|nr:hypothetical protein [Sulfuritalea sp.]
MLAARPDRNAPEDREAITPRDIEGMSQKLRRPPGLTLPGAKSRVQRARARLKARLTEACQVTFDESGRGLLLRAAPARSVTTPSKLALATRRHC